MNDTSEFVIASATPPRAASYAVSSAHKTHPTRVLTLVGVGLQAVSNMCKTVVELNKLLAGRGEVALVGVSMEDRPVREGRGSDLTAVRTVFRMDLHFRRPQL